MASRTLYPPIVSESQPAFVAGPSSQLKVYFSLSALSSLVDVSNLTVQVSILRKDGVKVINTENDVTNERYRATGIILNLIPQKDALLGDNYYYIVINNSDLKSVATLSGNTYRGWIPGWIYKIQLRLSTDVYPGGDVKQAAWLQEHSNNFSEWSTICYVKAISEMGLQIPLFEFNSLDKTQTYNNKTVHILSNVDFFGSLGASVLESNENFNYVKVSLYRDERLLEDSGEIFKSELSDTYFSYKFKNKFINNEQYEIRLTYETENGYSPEFPYSFLFQVNERLLEPINAQIITIDTNNDSILSDLTSIDQEEEEGRIGLKIFSPSSAEYSGNICISRASAKDNFTTWEDIKIFTVKNQDLNSYPIIYDYTIESGVWYKYNLQSISHEGQRSQPVEMQTPIRRIFNNCYLLGQNEQQLKINFNNTVSNFKNQIIENKQETIGSKYPYINRNAEVNYKTFSIGGLISFWEDEAQTFLKNGKLDIYKFSSVVENYNRDNAERNIKQYDYTYERDFRNKVMEFLCDGKPKLFKSSTEGNIIVRLMDINFTPNEQLGRMIYSFTANANEIDDNTMENYLKYGFYIPGTYTSEFGSHMTYLGQLNGVFNSTDNIFKLIYDKYDSQGKAYGGLVKKLENIQRVKITINDPPLRIRNNINELTSGNNIRLVNNGKTSVITIYNYEGIYEFDSLMEFHYYGKGTTGNDELYLLGDAEGAITKVSATIDFLYGLAIEPETSTSVVERKTFNGLGQFFETVAPNTSIYNSIYYKYYFQTLNRKRYLSHLISIEIEANPHTVFGIKDAGDSSVQMHEIGESGILRLDNLTQIVNLVYLGKRYLTAANDESTASEEIITRDTITHDPYGNKVVTRASADVMVTYYYEVVEEIIR